MKIKIKQIKTSGFTEISELDKSENVVVYEKDDNSCYEGVCHECTQEFFENIYNTKGSFWKLYENCGFAIKPDRANYVKFLWGNMYFNKVIEEKYINWSGMLNEYDIKGGNVIINKPLTVRNAILFLSFPFDEIRRFVNISKFAFYANEMLESYERLYRNAIEYFGFYSDIKNIYDPIKTARDSMNRAVEMMEYSIAASICEKYDIQIRKSKYISNCEIEKLSIMIEAKDTEAIRNEFGFYSLYPYDISSKRICESNYDLAMYGGFKIPSTDSVKWRENVKFLVSRYISIIRNCFKILGQRTGIGDLVYFLKIADFEGVDLQKIDSTEKLATITRGRAKIHDIFSDFTPSKTVFVKNGRCYAKQSTVRYRDRLVRKFKAKSASIRKIAQGPAVNINSITDYSKCTNGCIIMSKSLSPNLVVLFNRAAGIVSENGSLLSHAAIVAREMNIPCLIGASQNLAIADGEVVNLNGKTGEYFVITDAKKAERGSTHNKKNEINANIDRAVLKEATKETDLIVLDKGLKKDFYMLGDGTLRERNAGNKAKNLSEIYNIFNVPDGFVIDSNYFNKAVSHERIKNIIKDLLKNENSDMAALEEGCGVLKREINRINFSKNLREEIDSYYKKLSSGIVSVRSSSSCEDGSNTSFAGQFDSYLNIDNKEDLYTAIKNCWSSFYSPRSIIYRREKKIKDNMSSLAVLVQRMIDARYSGIAFSKDVMNGNGISIEVIPGTCEKLASGEVSPNVYVVERETLSILKVNANFDFDDNLITEISDQALKVEKYFKMPQDIEWCIDEKNKLWLIQARPITSTCNI